MPQLDNENNNLLMYEDLVSKPLPEYDSDKTKSIDGDLESTEMHTVSHDIVCNTQETIMVSKNEVPRNPQMNRNVQNNKQDGDISSSGTKVCAGVGVGCTICCIIGCIVGITAG